MGIGGTLQTYIDNRFPTSDAASIAPFWSDIDQTIAGFVSYRILDSTSTSTVRDDNLGLFNKVEDVACQVGAGTDFEADWVLVATWVRVPFVGTTSGCKVVSI